MTAAKAANSAKTAVAIWASVVAAGVLALGCGRDPLLPTTVSVDGGGGRGGAGGSDGGGRGGSDGGGRAETGGPGDATVEVRPGEVPLVLLPAEVPPLPVGRSFRMRALVHLGNDWRDVSSDPMIVWQSDQPSIAEVATGNGRVTAMKVGRTQIRAAHPLFGIAQAPLTVTDRLLKEVVVRPVMVELAVGQTRQLSAQALYDDGSAVFVTDAAGWSSGDQRIVRVQSSVPPLGEISAIMAGTIDVTAEFAGLSGRSPVTVTGSGSPVLSIAPLATSIPVGSTTRFQALLRQPTGMAVDVSTLGTWTSSNVGAARSLGGGQVRCVSAGTATISVTHSGQTVSAAMTCVAAGTVMITSIAINVVQNGPMFINSPYGPLTVERFFTDGSSRLVDDPSLVDWESSDEAIATVDPNRPFVGKVPGTVTITARFGGFSATESYTFSAR
jgi:uncharacterized protein YjdB